MNSKFITKYPINKLKACFVQELNKSYKIIYINYLEDYSKRLLQRLQHYVSMFKLFFTVCITMPEHLTDAVNGES